MSELGRRGTSKGAMGGATAQSRALARSCENTTSSSSQDHTKIHRRQLLRRKLRPRGGANVPWVGLSGDAGVPAPTCMGCTPSIPALAHYDPVLPCPGLQPAAPHAPAIGPSSTSGVILVKPNGRPCPLSPPAATHASRDLEQLPH